MCAFEYEKRVNKKGKKCVWTKAKEKICGVKTIFMYECEINQKGKKKVYVWVLKMCEKKAKEKICGWIKIFVINVLQIFLLI